MVRAPLTPGNHPVIVYMVNQTDSSMGTLKRYDVTTGSKTVIVDIPNTSIGDAQISADGQWILFTSFAGNSGQQSAQSEDLAHSR
jgi:hypothetical protein